MTDMEKIVYGDPYFECPNCKSDEDIDFDPGNYVTCIKCKWMFNFTSCKTVNKGLPLYKARDD